MLPVSTTKCEMFENRVGMLSSKDRNKLGCAKVTHGQHRAGKVDNQRKRMARETVHVATNTAMRQGGKAAGLQNAWSCLPRVLRLQRSRAAFYRCRDSAYPASERPISPTSPYFK